MSEPTPTSSSTEALELMQQYVAVLRRLNELSICRTNNSPTGDYAEWLVAQKLGLKLKKNSQLGYDAYRPATANSPEIHYQIKGRRVRQTDSTVEFSAIRGLAKEHFEFLILVAFNEDFSVKYALQIPYALVTTLFKMNTHVNGHRPIIGNGQLANIRQLSGVVDLTTALVPEEVVVA